MTTDAISPRERAERLRERIYVTFTSLAVVLALRSHVEDETPDPSEQTDDPSALANVDMQPSFVGGAPSQPAAPAMTPPPAPADTRPVWRQWLDLFVG